MKIGIIGSGNMGRSLGMPWAEQGHEIFFGARTAEKGQLRHLSIEGRNAAQI